MEVILETRAGHPTERLLMREPRVGVRQTLLTRPHGGFSKISNTR